MKRDEFEHIIGAAANIAGVDDFVVIGSQAIVLSKCAAGRPRDWDYARDALSAGIVEAEVLLERVGHLPLDAVVRDHVHRMLAAIVAELAVD